MGDFARKLPDEGEDALIERGVRALEACFRDIGDGRHIVPLSGGMDSRAILGGLIDAGLKDDIIAVTFGSPGIYDYEIAEMIVNKFGLEHVKIDISNVKIDSSILLEAAKTGGAWTFLFEAVYNSFITNHFGKDAIYWGGYLGGELAGSHIPREESMTWDAAKSYFVRWNTVPHSVNLAKPGLMLEDVLPERPFVERSVMSFDDQLDFGIRQVNFTRNINLRDGFNFRTPFLTREWVDFCFRIPLRYRLDERIYRKILVRKFPELFAIPSANFLGGKVDISNGGYFCRRALNRIRSAINAYPYKRGDYFRFLDPVWRSLRIFARLNYIDYGRAIMFDENYRTIVRENLDDLKQRGAVDWLDLDAIFRDHIEGRSDNGLELILLATLELSLKAEDEV
ncbi:MAG TPA: hypothetical protein ENN07_01940 [candidate division Zixibacteria bacterium]|nr:hypothetical protein [candidate division Zixibacteria bacterium]